MHLKNTSFKKEARRNLDLTNLLLVTMQILRFKTYLIGSLPTSISLSKSVYSPHFCSIWQSSVKTPFLKISFWTSQRQKNSKRSQYRVKKSRQEQRRMRINNRLRVTHRQINQVHLNRPQHPSQPASKKRTKRSKNVRTKRKTNKLSRMLRMLLNLNQSQRRLHLNRQYKVHLKKSK